MKSDPSQVTEAFVCCLSGLERRIMAHSSDFSKRFQLVRKNATLYREYDIRVGKRPRLEHVDGFLRRALEGDKINSAAALNAAYNGVLRLADLLGLRREQALSRLLIVPSLTARELEMAVSVISDMERWEGFDDFMAEMNAHLVQAAQGDSILGDSERLANDEERLRIENIAGSVGCDARLLELLSFLASQNSVHCSESALLSSVEAARWQRLFKEIANRFHVEDAFSTTKNASVSARAVTSNMWPAYKERDTR